MSLARYSTSIMKGLVAGAAGTAAITAFQMLEMKLSGRGPGSAPAEAVEKVLDVEPRSKAAEERLATLTHFAYGTSWGALYGVMRAAGVGPAAATGGLMASVWGAALVMLPTLRIAPKPSQWGTGELALDAVRHGVYAGAVGAAYEAMPA